MVPVVLHPCSSPCLATGFFLTSMTFHPLSDLFPLMPEPELRALADDIKTNGLKYPICLYEGKILDGRNRYRACQLAKIKPEFQDYKGSEPLAHVVSLNLARRHLNESQRAMVAARLANLPAHRPRKEKSANLPTLSVSQPEAAQLLNVSERSLRTAKSLMESEPELAKQVELGELPVSKALKQARKKKQRAKQRAALRTISKGDILWTMTKAQDVVPCAAVITDPPYGILDEPWEPEQIKEFTCEWLKRWDGCKADSFCIFWSQRHLWSGRLWLDDALFGYEFQQLLIWHYPNNKSPQSRKGFKHTWEPIFFYRRIGSSRQVGLGGTEWGDGLNDFDCHVAAVPQSNFNGAEMKQHPAQKPVSVFRWLINAVTQPGELVCDPFAGSGTSGIAAVQLKRRYHGIETDDKFLKLAKERIALYGK